MVHRDRELRGNAGRVALHGFESLPQTITFMYRNVSWLVFPAKYCKHGRLERVAYLGGAGNAYIFFYI
jgi:hypothetical protein